MHGPYTANLLNHWSYSTPRHLFFPIYFLNYFSYSGYLTPQMHHVRSLDNVYGCYWINYLEILPTF